MGCLWRWRVLLITYMATARSAWTGKAMRRRRVMRALPQRIAPLHFILRNSQRGRREHSDGQLLKLSTNTSHLSHTNSLNNAHIIVIMYLHIFLDENIVVRRYLNINLQRRIQSSIVIRIARLNCERQPQLLTS